jgi:recombination protein RecA
MDREKALEMALAQIDKQFGKGSIMRLGDKGHVGVEAIPTGALSLDLALGIGGLPRGRVVEIYGPESSGKSTLAMHVVAEAQRNGGMCAYIDAEHAMDPVYAKAIGVNVDDLLISQPDTGEQALEIADMLIRSGALDVLVIDSVAALVPRAEIEGEMGDTHMGLQARLMSQALRKLTGNLNKSRTVCVFINQLREKIGVMFGCLSYGTRITLADGTQEKIGKIVNQKLPVEVLSYDPDSGQVVTRKVVNWFDNGLADAFLQFTVAKPGGNGKAQFGVTENHLIQTPAGWREAGELLPGDRVMQSTPIYLSDFQWQVILGGVMGDGALSPTRSGHGARFRFGHGVKQVDYADWKGSLFANVTASRSTNAKDAVFYDVQPMAELAELRRAVYTEAGKVFSCEYLKQLTPLSLAIWYMDDGTFSLRAKGLQARTAEGSGRSEICIQAMEPTTRARLVEYLADTWSIRPRLVDRAGKAVLVFPKDETAKLHALIAPFVHPSMQYKLLPKYQGRFDVGPVFTPMRHELVPMPILDIHVKPNARSMHRFDLEVEGTHNYFADGVMVHNSPETTPGGRALKFYASVRLDIRRVETIKDGAEMIGNRARVKVVKNKCVAAGTLVFDPSTGELHPIEKIVHDGVAASVVAADKQGRLSAQPIGERFVQGQREVIGLRLSGDTTLRVTPDHRVLTDHGWVEAADLRVGDRLARPRRFGSFGASAPVTPDEARLIGYLIGDGYVGGKTPIAFINTQESLLADAAAIAEGLGCTTRRRGLESFFSHRAGEHNGVLELARRCGIWGKLAPEKTIAPCFFADDVAEPVIANLLFGLLESDGHVSREHTGALRVGYTTTSQQLAHQVSWLLLRFGVVSSVRHRDPSTQRPSLIGGRRVQGKLPTWEVRITGVENVERFAQVVPMWGPRGQVLAAALADPAMRKHRGSQANYLPACVVDPILDYLAHAGVTAELAARLVGESAGDPRGGMGQVLGSSRLRRDRVERIADALDSEFLRGILADDLWYDRIVSIDGPELADVYDIEVIDDHNFVADGVVVHNCASPFRQAEFDIMYGKGISREGSLLDVGVDFGIIKKSGAWFTYEGEQLGQGREKVKQFLSENTDLMIEISEKIRVASGIDDVAVIQPDVDLEVEDDAEVEID